MQSMEVKLLILLRLSDYLESVDRYLRVPPYQKFCEKLLTFALIGFYKLDDTGKGFFMISFNWLGRLASLLTTLSVVGMYF